MSVPPVLLEPAFDPLWRRIAERLEQRGLDDRRPVDLPQGLDDVVYARLGDVLRRRFPTTKRRLDLAALDAALTRYGTDLAAALGAAGHAPAGRKEIRDAQRALRAERDDVLATVARERLGEDPWVTGWVAAVRPGVADAATARYAVDVVDRVLREAGAGRSRGEVAARVLGGAHELDRGRAARRWVHAALVHRAGGEVLEVPDVPDLWAAAGLPGDVVSGPVLTWALPLLGDGVTAAVRALTAAGAPAPLTTLTLRDLTVAVPPGTVVLSVENPRLLEAAVQQRLPAAVVCTAGEPTTGALALLEGLVTAGATVRHHGDLDAGGLRITARLAARGVVPWRMTADDYRAGVVAAGDVPLRAVDPQTVPPTPWDPGLAAEMRRRGVAVEQERVMDDLLAAHACRPS